MHGARRLLFSSRRRRRRLGWLVVTATVVGAAVAVSLIYSKSASYSLPKARPGKPSIPTLPKTVKLGHEEGRVRRVAAQFVATAVERRNIAQSFDLTSPSLRRGFTRKQWAQGTIPVVPYPHGDLDYAAWTLRYSYKNRVGL